MFFLPVDLFTVHHLLCCAFVLIQVDQVQALGRADRYTGCFESLLGSVLAERTLVYEALGMDVTGVIGARRNAGFTAGAA
ncbi:hypothetical protein Ptc2401_02172 [Prosthecochloris sp. CIB 2401]|nr:hypothetical protein Ptc2401_02172 [Prosthecochloris sp. CIB 2401]